MILQNIPTCYIWTFKGDHSWTDYSKYTKENILEFIFSLDVDDQSSSRFYLYLHPSTLVQFFFAIRVGFKQWTIF